MTVETAYEYAYCKNIPINDQMPYWTDTFDVYVFGNEVTVQRTDNGNGWGQALEFSCCGADVIQALEEVESCEDGQITVDYYDTEYFDGFVGRECWNEVNTCPEGYNYDMSGCDWCPDFLTDCDNFSALLTQTIPVTDEAVYVTFFESSDDIAQFFIDGELVHSSGDCSWVDGNCGEYEFSVYLDVGEHDFELYFIEYNGGAYLFLSYTWQNGDVIVGAEYEYIGCYADYGGAPDHWDADERDLQFMASASSSNPEKCAGHCAGAGYSYFGLQYGGECFCDNSYGSYGEATNCDMSCADDYSDTMCGGLWANSVYSIGNTVVVDIAEFRVEEESKVGVLGDKSTVSLTAVLSVSVTLVIVAMVLATVQYTRKRKFRASINALGGPTMLDTNATSRALSHELQETEMQETGGGDEPADANP